MSGFIVIGTDVGEIGDIIEDGITGFIVKERDCRALYEIICRCISGGTDKNKIISKSREKIVKKFSWVNISKKYKKTLLEVI